MIHSSTRPSNYCPHIDGLRALAVLAVIVNHCNRAWLPGGYLGVDVFFVISGFVITSSLLASPSGSLGELLAGFYTRRVRRLIPALIACVVVTSVLIAIFDPTPNTSLRTGACALFGLSNLYLLRLASDYFAPASVLNAFTQTWSLGIEEQFYVFFPVLLWFSGAGRMPAGVRRLSLLMAGLALVSIVSFFHYSQVAPRLAYFLMPARFWELAVGCLAFLLALQICWPRVPRTTLANLALAALIVVLCLPQTMLVPATFASVGLAALLLLALVPGSVAYMVLTTPLAVHVGRISYSLYLWHWTVLCLARWTVGIHALTLVPLLLVIFTLATVSYYGIESPLRHRQWSTGRWQTLGMGVVASAVAAMLTGGLLNVHQQLYRMVWDSPDDPPAFQALPGSGLPFDPTCVVDSGSRPLRDNTFAACTLPPLAPGRQMIWTMGDSHAGHLQAMLYAIHGRLGVGVEVVETPGLVFPAAVGIRNASQERLFEAIRQRARRGDILLVSRLFMDRQTRIPASDIAQWSDALGKLAGALALDGISVVVVGPTPHFEYDNVHACRAGSWLRNRDCDRERATLLRTLAPIDETLRTLAARVPNMHVFDAFEVLCPSSVTHCTPDSDGSLLFFDADHLNALGSTRLAGPFARFLARQGLLEASP